MTWHAPGGQIILEGKEANLFRAAILDMCDFITNVENDKDCIFGGARVFDCMTRTQQIASLEAVSKYLFQETDVSLKLSAWSEATLASILRRIRLHIDLEIDVGESNEIRQSLVDITEHLVSPSPWDDHDEWTADFEAYESRFLWDLDFEIDSLSDMAPEHASLHREMFDIDDDYFVSMPPDLNAEWDIPQAVKRIWMLIDGKKTVELTVTLTTEVPQTMGIEESSDFGQIIRGCYPHMTLMCDLGNGTAEEVNDELFGFFAMGGEFYHRIKELTTGQIDTN